jgi:hypothetical protein
MESGLSVCPAGPLGGETKTGKREKLSYFFSSSAKEVREEEPYL